MLKSPLSFKTMNKVLFTVKIPPSPSCLLTRTHTADWHSGVEILLLQRSHVAYKQTGAITQRREIDMKTRVVWKILSQCVCRVAWEPVKTDKGNKNCKGHTARYACVCMWLSQQFLIWGVLHFPAFRFKWVASELRKFCKLSTWLELANTFSRVS